MIPAITSGMYMGEIVGFSLSGIMVESEMKIGSINIGGWQSVFYIFGLVGVVWFPYWAMFAYDTPDSHPHISIEEIALIRKGKDYSSVRRFEQEQKKRKPSLLMGGPYEIHVVESVESGGQDGQHVEYATNPLAQQLLSNDVHCQPERTVSLISYEDKEEAAARIPWMAFFTNAVSLTFFVNAWVFVSLFCRSHWAFLLTTSG
jgi:hypothetical protein